MNKIIVANWKMNLSLKQASEFCMSLVSNESLIIAAPSLYLAYLVHQFPNIKFASQNVSHVEENEGAFTGEYSAYMLNQCGVNYSVIGHAERRILFNETNEQIKQKAINCVDNNIIPIICVGEKEKGDIDYIKKQIEESIPSHGEFILAYEPIWAIGGSSDISISYIEEISYKISQYTPKLIYGGSVNENNIQGILKIKKVDGVMLGRLSLNINKINQIN